MISPYGSPTDYGWHSRTFIMSKDLVNRGHQVTVFSFTGSHYLHLKNKSSDIPNDENHEGVAYKWFKTFPFFKSSSVSRLLNWYLYNYQFSKWLVNYKGQAPDAAIFSIPALHHCLLIKPIKDRFKEVNISIEIRDIWPLSIQCLGGYTSNHWFVKQLKTIEQFAVENSDRIIAVQPGIKKYFDFEFNSKISQKLVIIPHLYDAKDVLEFTTNIDYDIVYAGTLSKANDVNTLIEALFLLSEKNVYPKTLIIGQGTSFKTLKEKAKNLKNVAFKTWLHRNQVLEFIAKSRVCYDGFLDLSLYEYGFSRLKWVDYLLMKKPILASYSGGEIDFDINKLGWKVQAEQPQLLADKIHEIIELPDSALEIKANIGFELLKEKRDLLKMGKLYEQTVLND